MGLPFADAHEVCATGFSACMMTEHRYVGVGTIRTKKAAGWKLGPELVRKNKMKNSWVQVTLARVN